MIKSKTYSCRPSLIRKYMIKINCITILILLSVSEIKGQNLNEPVKAFSIDDSLVMRELVGNSNVIGIGESAHGQGSIKVFRSDIIKKLITDYHFKNIVLESFFWGTQSLNKYIHNTYEGDVKKAFLDMGVGEWMNYEMLEFINWVKAYNLKIPDSLKVNLYGCDVWSLQPIANHFKNHPWITANLTQESKAILDSLASNNHWQGTSSGKKSLDKLYKELKQKYKPNTFNTIEENYLVELVGGVIDKYKKTGGYRGSLLRDKIMAKTLLYLYNQKPNEKFVIIAHNEHILKSRNSTYLYPMGKHIYKKLGDRYHAIAITFRNGSIEIFNRDSFKLETVKVSAPIHKSIEYLTSNYNLDIAYINLDSNKTHPLVNKKTKIRSIGSRYIIHRKNQYYTRQKLYRGYNALFIINIGMASRGFYKATKIK